MPSNLSKETLDMFSNSNTIVSQFLALEHIYNTQELDAYMQCIQKDEIGTQYSESSSVDVVVLCASAILAVPEAVFGWACQQGQMHPDTQQRDLVLVLCGGIGPRTPFFYDAIKASNKYCQIFKDIYGKPEGQVLKIMAERFYGLKINGTQQQQPVHESQNTRFNILVADRSMEYGVDASGIRKVLEHHGIRSPRSILVVQDPAMSNHTVLSFEETYVNKEAQVFSWPRVKPMASSPRAKSQSQAYRKESAKELWSMDRFLDRIWRETSRPHAGQVPSDSGNRPRIDIPNEVEDAWSTFMDKHSITAIA
ncbi:hypothetical protein F66182_6162 [Fusarium sp. NRRL 66182]|nr:hypothetical protein F66182_6162 [Fusarium sp. NRRL 66182]